MDNGGIMTNYKDYNEYIASSVRGCSDESECTVLSKKIMKIGDTFEMDGILWIVDDVVEIRTI